MPNDNFNFRDPNDLWNGMDIIPWGEQKLDDPSQELVDDWSRDIGQRLIEGRQNDLYVRTQNLTGSSQSTRIYLDVTPSSLFTQPSKWQQRQATNGENDVEVSAGPHQKVASREAYREPPTSLRESPFLIAYCLP